MTRGATERATVHAGCIVVGEAGILLRGDSGAGKSGVALEAVERAAAAGLFAAHVADDRVRLERHGGRLVARPVPAISGCLELRGVGVVTVAAVPAAVVRLVVDLASAPPDRLPDPGAGRVAILGIDLPRLSLEAARAAAVLVWQLRGADDTPMTGA